jgi:hypothetical protein
MMKKTFSIITGMLLILCMTSNLSHAQLNPLKRFSIGPFVEAGIPIGDLSDTHNTGFGAGLGADVKLIGGLAVTGSVSYMRFGGKEIDIAGVGTTKIDALQAVPVRVGLRYKFPIPLLYVKVESGAANYIGDGPDGSAVIFSPGIGIRILGFDFQAKYEGWYKSEQNVKFWGLKAGWNF